MKRALRALVVDDEPLARDELGFMLGELGVEVSGEANSAKAALAHLDDDEPDMIFIDLRMPGLSGIALAETLRARFGKIPIIMVSAHDDGALRAFEVEVNDYLLKPVRLERLKKAIDRVRECVQPGPAESPLDRIAVRRKGVYVVVDIEDVLCFQVKDELVWAVTAADRYDLDLTLAAVERRVMPQDFFRSHRSCLVRLSAITVIEPVGTGAYELVLSHPDEMRLPLARERVRLLRERIPFAG